MLSWVGLNLGSAPEIRGFPQIHEYTAPGHQRVGAACAWCFALTQVVWLASLVCGIRVVTQLARCCPHSVCLARIAGSRARLTFVKSMTTKCPITMCDSACLVLCTQFVCFTSLVLRQTCHSRSPGAASTQFVMAMHRWLRVHVFFELTL